MKVWVGTRMKSWSGTYVVSVKIRVSVFFFTNRLSPQQKERGKYMGLVLLKPPYYRNDQRS